MKNFKKREFTFKYERNLLYFYFPSVSKDIKEGIIKLINNEILIEGIKYDTSANNYIYKCGNSLNILNSLIDGIKDEEFHKFLSILNSLLNVKFRYIDDFE